MATLEELESQVALLQQTVDQLTTPPTDYYTHRWSGEEIDKGVASGLTMGGAETTQEALAALGAGVRPSLLINGYFQRPVNQRGNTLYSGTGYGIDGWRSYSSSAQMEIISGGIKVTGTGGIPSFFQKLEDDLIVAGTEFTFSAFLTEVTGTVRLTARFGYGNSDAYLSQAFCNVPEPGVYAVTFTIPENATTMRVGISSASNGSAIARAMKLEYGPNQTLGYQDSDGNWQLLPQPDDDYATQLLWCRIFAFDLTGEATVGYVGTGYAETANTARIIVPIPQSFRTTPVVSYSGDWYITTAGHAGASGYPVTNMSVNTVAENCVALSVTTSGMTLGESVALHFRNGGRCWLDASL